MNRPGTYGQLRRQLEGEFGELLSSHDETEADLSAFEGYADDPVGFIREVLGGDPWERQVEIAEAVRDHEQVAVRSCNGAGKDWLAARLALWWCYARGGLVVLTGPTQAQVEEILMRREVRDAFNGSGLPGGLHVRALRPGGEGRAGILAKTASEVSALTGLHDAEVLFVITEAQHDGLDLAFDAAFANAVGEDDRKLALGNPLNPAGRFYRISKSADWRAIRIPASDVPNVREGRTVVPGLVTRRGVERIASEYGQESGYYKARVLAEFPEESEAGVFRRAWLDNAAERWRDAEPGPAGRRVFAVDPARYGPDASVLAIRLGGRLEEFVVWEGRVDTMELVDRVRRVLEERGFHAGTKSGRGVEVRVDEVGLGGGVLDRLKEVGYRAKGFNGGKQAKESGRYFNRRAEAYWHLRRKLEAGEVELPPEDELFEELLALRWRPTPDGRVQLERKDDLKSRLGRSPDRADATVMAMWDSPTVGVRWGRSRDDEPSWKGGSGFRSKRIQ